MNLSDFYFLLYLPVFLILCWGVIHFFLFISSRLFIYQWWRAPKYGAPPENAEILSFTENSKDLYAWFFTPDHPLPSKWVVFFHGNYSTIDRQMDAVNGYLQLGYQVLLPEYHGFRQLKGWPTRKNIRTDLIDLLQRVSAEKNLALSDCVFHCFSLGGIIGPDLLSDLKPAAVIIEATVPSPKEFMSAYALHHRVLLDQYDNLPLLQSYLGKLLVISFLKDDIVPPRFMRTFKECLPKGTFLEWHQGHNTIRRSSEAPQYWQAIRDFLN